MECLDLIDGQDTAWYRKGQVLWLIRVNSPPPVSPTVWPPQEPTLEPINRPFYPGSEADLDARTAYELMTRIHEVDILPSSQVLG